MRDSTPRILIVGSASPQQLEVAQALKASGCRAESFATLDELPESVHSATEVVVVDLNAIDPKKLASAVGSSAASSNSSQVPSACAHGRTPESLRKLAHDLRTPLNAILGWTQLLKFGDLDDRMKQEALDTIERSAKAQAEMISNMLDLPPT
jgi:signal transduction histidine kinase